MSEPPIQNLDSMDILGRRNDGGIDCVIVALKLEDTDEHEMLLKQKIQNYVDAIMSEEFAAEFGAFSQANTRIIISCTERPHENIVQLIEIIAVMIKEYGIALDWKVETSEDGEDFGGEYQDDIVRTETAYTSEPTANVHFPTWAVYIIAPLLILIFSIPVLISVDSPVIVVIFALGSGLICAASMHFYLWIKSKIKGKK